MRLPPVDVYRKPFVEPLGHLALNAAALDLELIEFIAQLLPEGDDTGPEQVAHQLRNWSEVTRKYVREAIDLIDDVNIAKEAHELVGRMELLRDARHRALHDAVEVGIAGDGVAGYEALSLRVGYVRTGRAKTDHQVISVTPAEVAALAYEFYEARLALDVLGARLFGL